MRLFLAAFLIISRLLGSLPVSAFATPSQPAQESAEVRDLGVEVQFGNQVTFKARVMGDAAIQEVLLYITPVGQPTVWHEVTLLSQNEIRQPIDIRQLSLRPFSETEYRYQITLADGSLINSPNFRFRYDDDRFTWQKLEGEAFRIFWYGRETTFGQEVMNVAVEGLRKGQGILNVAAPSPITIYVYTSSQDLQSALQLTHQPWIAGHAAPDLGQVMISIPDGPQQKLELERQVPHEVMHILQYQVIGTEYRRQPVWVLEGMASIAELYPNPEYQRVLTATAAGQELLPLSSLCSGFPRESSGAFQAYAQSESFVRFLHIKFGNSGLNNLIQQYQDGLGCEEGVVAAFGVSLGQLETRWREEALGLNPGKVVLRNLSPFLVLLLLIALPVLLALYPVKSAKPRLEEKS